MSLTSEYLAQERWRPWDAMLGELQLGPGEDVLDLGCGPGTVAARLADRGASVIGIDHDPDLLAVAHERCPASCRFVEADLKAPLPPEVPCAGGIWSSFVAAYFPRLEGVLPDWLDRLRPGGWIALVEIDRMFTGHRPLGDETRRILERAARLGREHGLYDPDMGSKLTAFLEDAGLEVMEHSTWPDAELAFQGPAQPEILDAWRRRFARMPALRRWLGEEAFARLQDDVLAGLAAPDHTTDSAVVMVVARKPG